MDSILLKSNRFCVIDKFILLTAFIEKATAVVLKMFIFFQKISRINTTDHRPPGSRKFLELLDCSHTLFMLVEQREDTIEG